MPKPYPQEFRDDVVRVARAREAGVTLAQIARDFGIHEMTLDQWMRQADIDDGNRPGTSRAESHELRDACRRIRLLEQENEVLRRAAAYLSQANLPEKALPRKREVPPPLVNELAADGIPVVVSLRVLGLARAPYYRWLAEPVTPAEWDRAHRANALFDAHRDDPEFGYRYLYEEAGAAGVSMSARTAWKLCSANAWWSALGKKRGRNGKRPGPPVHDDRLASIDEHGVTRHEFVADHPNQVWLSDITENWTTWIPANDATPRHRRWRHGQAEVHRPALDSSKRRNGQCP